MAGRGWGYAAIAAGALLGVAIDYFTGYMIVAAIIAAAVASSTAERLREALAYPAIASIIWLTASYAAVSLQAGALEMIRLAADIAGLGATLAYAIIYGIILALSISIGAAVYEAKGRK